MITRWFIASLAAAGMALCFTPEMAHAQKHGHGGGHPGGHVGGFHGGGHPGGHHPGVPHGGYHPGVHHGGYHPHGYSGVYRPHGYYGGWGWGGYPGFGFAYSPSFYRYSYPAYGYTYPAYEYGYNAPAYDSFVEPAPVYGSDVITSTDAVRLSTSGSTPSGNAALLQVRVPDPNADVLIDGRPTQARGTEREFVSPSLQPGYRYSYQLTVRWRDSAGPHEESRAVPVQAGQTATVDFSATSGAGSGKGE